MRKSPKVVPKPIPEPEIDLAASCVIEQVPLVEVKKEVIDLTEESTDRSEVAPEIPAPPPSPRTPTHVNVYIALTEEEVLSIVMFTSAFTVLAVGLGYELGQLIKSFLGSE